MKEEKEVYWLIKILKTEFKKKVLGKSKGGCKSEFARAVGVSRMDKDFRKFLNELINSGCLEYFQEAKMNGGFIVTYVINEKKIWNMIKNNGFGKNFYDMAVNDYTGF